MHRLLLSQMRTCHANTRVADRCTRCRDAYGLLVKAKPAPNETWRFLDAFSWQLWLSIPLTCIAVGCVVWALDRAAFWGHRASALNEPKSPLAPPTISAGTLNEKVSARWLTRVPAAAAAAAAAAVLEVAAAAAAAAK